MLIALPPSVKISLALTASLVVTCAFGAPDSAGLQARTPPAAGALKHVVWGLPKEPASLDPTQSNEFIINQVLSNLCEQLFVIDPDFKMQPWLASSVTQPNARTYVYEIRKGVRFWDGSPLTVEDVVFSLKRNMDPAVKSRWARYYVNVDKIEAEGDSKVRVTLKEPDVMFHAAMATAASAVVQQRHTEANKGQIGTAQVPPMCSGPFKLQAWNVASSIVMARNDAYWNTAMKPKATTFEFKFVTDTAAQVNGMLTRQIQGMYGPSGSAVAALHKSKSGKVYMGRSFSNYHLIPNQRPDSSATAFTEKLRQALSLAVDRGAIANNAYAGTGVPTLSPAPSATWSYGGNIFPDAMAKVGPPVVDLEKAKALVREAGPIAKPLVLGYGARSDIEQVATLVQDAGRKIGIPIELKAMPYGQFVASLFDPSLRHYDMLPMTKNVNMTEPLDFYSVFTPSFAALNFGRYENKSLVQLIEQARSEPEPITRARLVVKAQDVIIKEKVWIPLVEFANTLYMDNAVTGAPASYVHPYYPWAALVGSPK